jgi:hypothetical protein
MDYTYPLDAHSYPRVPAPPHPCSLPGRASRMAYRYLSQSHSFRPKVVHPSRNANQCADVFPPRILDTIVTEREEEVHDLLDSVSVDSDGNVTNSVTITTDPETHRIAGEKYAEYSAVLAPALELEGRLMRILRQDDDEDEATRLGDGSAPGWSTPRGEYAVRTTSNWKRALTLRRSRSNRISTSTRSWEDPSDPVHVLDRCRDAMIRLWNDDWIRGRLIERRVRVQESSGLCVSAPLNGII